MKYIPMTILGADKLKKELNYLKHIKRKEIIISISEAREHGDLKENAEYHAAREQQSFCENKIQNIESKLSKAQIIDITKITNNGHVIFGTTVTILNLKTNEKLIYRIVGDDEADIKINLISINSPIARGLIRKKINDVVLIKTPRENIKFKILNVEHI
ncbi:transcription elongation factor GreA [Candidatus Providencia siddallii]|uniref:Transcription elongation factor GreA n=1 Tax=Candidatus Providencia siddallii TaxID=1715285 RepID=A0ABM9NPG5_9GAMM